MKKLIIIVALFFCLPNLIIAQTFQSKLENGNCKQMTISYSSGDVYFHLADVGCTAGSKITVFNQTSISITSDRFTIPDDNYTYWIIPFDGSGPYQFQRGIAWCVNCCGCAVGGCTFHFGGGVLYCDGCTGCCMKLYPCDGGLNFKNGGVLVQANNIYEN